MPLLFNNTPVGSRWQTVYSSPEKAFLNITWDNALIDSNRSSQAARARCVLNRRVAPFPCHSERSEESQCSVVTPVTTGVDIPRGNPFALSPSA
jgi:hypothetical protein